MKYKHTKQYRARKATYILCAWLVVLSAVPKEANADPIIAAITAAVAELSISSVIAAIIKSLVASVILGGLSSMLAKKPKARDFDTSRTQLIKEPVSPRQYIFGRTRVSGALTFLSTYADHKRLEMCVTVAGHPCDGIETVYFDDQELTLDTNGNVVAAKDHDGKAVDTWVNNATIKFGLGTPATDAEWLSYATGQTAGDWTIDHRQTGCTKMWITINLSNKPGGGAVPNVSCIIRGMIAYDPRTELRSWTTNAAVLFREYLCLVNIIQPDLANVDDDTFITAANVCDEQVDTITATYGVTNVWFKPDVTQSAIPSGFGSISGAGTKPYIDFSSAHPFSNGDSVTAQASISGPNVFGPFASSVGKLSTAYVRVVSSTRIMLCPSYQAAMQPITDIFVNAYNWNYITYSGDLRITKSETFQYHNALTIASQPTRLRTGDKVRITSTGTAPGGLAFDTDYYVFQQYSDTSIISLASSLANAQASLPIDLTSTGSGTISVVKSGEARYTINGRLSSDTQPIDAIPTLLAAMVGTFVPVGGKYRVTAGAYSTPTLTFDETDLDGMPNTVTRIPLRDNFNSVKGTYFSPAAFYENTNFPPVKNDSYIARDGAQSFHDIDLPFTNSPGMCQRIGKCLIEAVRQQISTTWPMKLTGLKCKAGDIVMLNRASLGWVNKPFQVTSWQLTTRGDTDNLRLGVDVTFREISPTMFDWNSGLEQDIDDAPNSNLPNPFVVDAPGIPSITEQEVLTNDSESVKSVVVMDWDPTIAPNIRLYQAEYRPASTSTWIILPPVSGEASETTVYGLAAGLYDWRVKAMNALGVWSDYSAAYGLEVLAQLAVPATVEGLTIQEVSSLAVLRWTASTQPSVRINGHFRIRHSDQDLATASLANSVEIIPEVAGTANHAVVPLKEGTYLVFAQNSAGALSATPAKVSSAGATVLAFSTFATVQEDNTFPGTNSNTVVDLGPGLLKLDSLGDFDSIPDFDALADFDSMGGIVSSGTYTFSAGINMGSVQAVRLETRLQTTLVNILDDFDTRASNIDDWADFDGIATGIVGDAQIQVRTTQTDPTGSPTWSEWNWLVTADYNAWGFQFRLLLAVNDANYNIYVTQLGVTALQL